MKLSFQETVHAPIEWRTQIIVCPARVRVATLAVNAAVSPAIGVPWRDGLIVADAVSAARIRPHSKPRAGGTVIDKDRPTPRIVERALTIVLGDTDKSVAAVGRD